MNQSKTFDFRQASPAINLVDTLPVPNHKKLVLDNGVTLHLLPELNTIGFRIDLYFAAGIKHNLQPTTSNAAFNLMTEGTFGKSSEQIHESLDFYGSFLEKDIAYNYSKLTVFGTEPNFKDIFILIIDIISNASFENKEIDLYINRQKQRLLVDLQKNGTICKRAFAKAFWGTQHPLGNISETTDYDALKQSDLNAFFETLIKSGLQQIVLSGCCSNIIIDTIKELNIYTSTKATTHTDLLSDYIPQKGLIFIQKDESIQAAIHMGTKLINRKHPDFVCMQVVSTLLGGYFGSRLMKNIREEKGYTYGIGCSLQNIADFGVFSIHTEVLNDKWNDTLACIDYEINKLKTEPVTEEELRTVKNYMCGNLARLFDGSFAQADRLQMLLNEKLDWEYYTTYLNAIKNTSIQTVQLLANKYLNKEDFTTIVVGSK
ncbi:MAG: insulinase family protein [Bacteroidota bacterium]|nr:insulinase family protein [Bacteroidota bacterium]